MDPPRPRRSALYLPASNSRALAKARELDADVVILDLEDAVGPEEKDDARASAVAALQTGGFGRREVVVRVNALDTNWGAADLKAMAQAPAVLLPKVDAPRDLMAYRDALGARPRLWAMIETARAALSLRELAEASPPAGVEAWVMGVNDLAKEMRCRPGGDRAPLIPTLTLAVLAARSAGLVILDGVFNDLSDAEGLERECRQGADLGFDGKTLIHPTQLAAANAAFSPGPEALAWARAVVKAFAAPQDAGKGVLEVEGKMVERLHLTEAERVIALADAIAAREPLA